MTNNFEYFISDTHSNNFGRFLTLCEKASKLGYNLWSSEVNYLEVKEYNNDARKYPMGYKIRHIFRKEKSNVSR
jgi:hypothetical protein